MSRLQKNAWFGIGVAVMFAMISAIFIKSMTASNAGGKIYIIALVVACGVAGSAIVILSNKEDAKYDEREQVIRLKAFRWAACAWALVLALMCYVPFFVIGGAGNMGVYYLPAVFWCCILTAQVVYSAVILFQCRQEQSDE